MRILAYNPGHDGAISYLRDGNLEVSIEAEKDSNWRHSPISIRELLTSLSEVGDVPDAICVGGWWPRDHYDYMYGPPVQYRGVLRDDVILEQRRLFGRTVQYFSSSHERSHLMCAFGLSELEKGTPCYALIWEGEIGGFYEIDASLKITPFGDVLDQVGNRYAMLYGLADPTFQKNGAFPRIEDPGKLMALASFSSRKIPTTEEEELMSFLLTGPRRELSAYSKLKISQHYNKGVDDEEFRNFAGIYSDRIFDQFYQFARKNLKKGLPLVIAGGCGLNCDWNTKWRDTGLFSDVFVPPVANDSGSAIGTAIDAQFHLTGNPKVSWSVYSGLEFISTEYFDSDLYDIVDASNKFVADILANNLVLGWVHGKYEIGPRALGNRSIIAAPFSERTRTRLNEIKQREQFRPVAPVCLEEDAAKLFGCEHPSPFMLYTYRAKTDMLAAVTHVNGTARIQTVSKDTNQKLYELLIAFRARTGYGVLCNTSLNFSGKGFINKLHDLSDYTVKHKLDGFVVGEKAYLLKSSSDYRAYLQKTKYDVSAR